MTADIPGEDHDEPHQRAMYFAHGDINGFDFWGEAAFPTWSDHPASTFGRTVFRTLDDIQGGADGGRLQATFDLVAPDRQPIADEIQTYRFEGDEQSRIIDCEFAIHAEPRPDRDGGHQGRHVCDPCREGPGLTTRPHGECERRQRREGHLGQALELGGLLRDVWQARMSASRSLTTRRTCGLPPTGTPARTVCWRRIRSASKQFTGDRRQDGSYAIPAGGSLILRYRVFIHHGDLQQAGVAEAYRQFAAGK